MGGAKRYPSIASHGDDGFRRLNPSYVLNLYWSFAASVYAKTGSSDLPVGRFVDRAVESFFRIFRKIFVATCPKSRLELSPSHPTRGAYHDRHGRGEGCGGRGSVRRATWLQGGLAKGL